MLKRKLSPLLLLFLLLSHFAYSGADVFCEHTFTLSGKGNICSNLPFLAPDNDNRVNLMLLLGNRADIRATYEQIGESQWDSLYFDESNNREFYSLMPFELKMWWQEVAEENDDLLLEERIVQIDPEWIARIEAHFSEEYQYSVTLQALVHKKKELISADMDYLKALADAGNKLSDDELFPLVASRFTLKGEMEIADPTELAQGFIDYQQGANAFHNEQYDSALKAFIKGAKSQSSWIAEASTYMIARSLLQIAQASGIERWGYFDLNKVHREKAADADRAFREYLVDYPQGKYRKSATGLLRRTAWLMNHSDHIISAYESELMKSYLVADEINGVLEGKSYGSIIYEMERILPLRKTDWPDEDPAEIAAFEKLTQAPLLLTVQILKMMRNQGKGENLTFEKLQSLESYYRDHPQLYRYLVGAYFTYIEPVPFRVLMVLPELDNGRGALSSLALSKQILRALAFESAEDWEKAEYLWQALYHRQTTAEERSLLEMALALHYEKRGRYQDAFKQESLVKNEQLLAILIARHGDPKFIRSLVGREDLSVNLRAHILDLLLYHDLLASDYHTLINDLSLIQSPIKNQILRHSFNLGYSYKDQEERKLQHYLEVIPNRYGYRCGTIEATARGLIANKNDAVLLNCLASLFQIYGIEPAIESYLPFSSKNDNAHNLGTFKPNPPIENAPTILSLYQQVFNDNNADRNDRAYALVRAINCFARSGYNNCDGQKIEQAERERWFNLLKRNYGDTTWAKSQKYYW